MKNKILIIDDDHDFVDSIKIVLDEKYEVDVKYDTDDIVEAVKKSSPDLIILDVMFPEDQNAGFHAARKLARDEKINKIPVIIFSAVNQKSNLSFSFSDDDIDGGFLPVKRFLEKPIKPDELFRIVDELIS